MFKSFSKYALETICCKVYMMCAYMHVKSVLLTSQSTGENSSLSPERAIDSPFPY